MRILTNLAAAIALLFTTLVEVRAQRSDEVKQEALAFIRVKCLDESNGHFEYASGSGFLIEESGFILTASHVLSCIEPQTKARWKREEVVVRFGSPHEPPDRVVEVARIDEQTDLAILKVLGVRRKYPTLRACVLQNPPDGQFTALGFPKNSSLQEVDGRFGTAERERGRWGVASPFEEGMSGGPVFYNGHVVGIIEGGAPGSVALRTVAPLHKAKSMIEDETGIRLEKCPARRAETTPTKQTVQEQASRREATGAGTCDLREARTEVRVYRYQGAKEYNPAEFRFFHAAIRDLVESEVRGATLTVTPMPDAAIEEFPSAPTLDAVKDDWRRSRMLIGLYGKMLHQQLSSSIYWGDWGGAHISQLKERIQPKAFLVNDADATFESARYGHLMMVFFALAMDAERRNCDRAHVMRLLAAAKQNADYLAEHNGLTDDLRQVSATIDAMLSPASIPRAED